MRNSYLTQRAISWWTKAQDFTIFAIPPHTFPTPLFLTQKSPSVFLSLLGRKCKGYSFPTLEQSTKHDFIVLKARIIDSRLLVHSNLFEMPLTVNQHKGKEERKGQCSQQTESLPNTARVPRSSRKVHQVTTPGYLLFPTFLFSCSLCKNIYTYTGTLNQKMYCT